MPIRDHRIFNRGRQATDDIKFDKIGHDIEQLGNRNYFETAVITEFISNPEEFLKIPVDVDIVNEKNSLRSKSSNSANNNQLKKSNMLEELTTGTKKVLNPYMVRIMPRNSIIGYNIANKKGHTEKDPEVFFPFFPAHFSMPAKPGEHIWVFYEVIDDQKIGYWLFRKTGTINVDDLNYTSVDRQVNVSTLNDLSTDPGSKINKNKFKSLVENLAYQFPDPRTGGDGSGNLNIDPDSIVKDSISYSEEFVGENVPRYSKKCSDLVLQGSNNTLISLSNEDDVGTGKISIVAGRGQLDSTKGEAIKNIRGKTAKNLEYYELDKTSGIHSNIVNHTEGDIIGQGSELAKLELKMAGGGSIEMSTSNQSFLHIDNTQIALSKSPAQDYSLGQITILNENIGIEAPNTVSIRSPGGEIRLAHGSLENPTNDANILMNQGNEAYVKLSILTDIINSLQQQILTLSLPIIQIATAQSAVALAKSTALATNDPPGSAAAAQEAAEYSESAAAAETIVTVQPGATDLLLGALGSNTIFGS